MLPLAYIENPLSPLSLKMKMKPLSPWSLLNSSLGYNMDLSSAVGSSLEGEMIWGGLPSLQAFTGALPVRVLLILQVFDSKASLAHALPRRRPWSVSALHCVDSNYCFHCTPKTAWQLTSDPNINNWPTKLRLWKGFNRPPWASLLTTKVKIKNRIWNFAFFLNTDGLSHSLGSQKWDVGRCSFWGHFHEVRDWDSHHRFGAPCWFPTLANKHKKVLFVRLRAKTAFISAVQVVCYLTDVFFALNKVWWLGGPPQLIPLPPVFLSNDCNICSSLCW